MATSLATNETTQVARPLNVLVPLIKEDFLKAKEAADRASHPYFQMAAEKMCEARAQMTYSEFTSWAHRHFGIKTAQADKYLRLGKYTGNYPSARVDSISDFQRRIGESPRGAERGGASWHDPVKQILGRVDVNTLRDTELKRADERDASRKLALQLIDIGYKALATKLHPDKGGSRDAMSRLNTVRDRLKAHA
jgi:hypothetical protein